MESQVEIQQIIRIGVYLYSIYLFALKVVLLVILLCLEFNWPFQYGILPLIFFDISLFIITILIYKKYKELVHIWTIQSILLDTVVMIFFRLGIFATSFTKINLFILGIPVFFLAIKAIFTKNFCKNYLDFSFNSLRLGVLVFRALVYLFISIKLEKALDWSSATSLCPLLFLSIAFFLISLLSVVKFFKEIREERPREEVISMFWKLSLSLYLTVNSTNFYISLTYALMTGDLSLLKYSCYFGIAFTAIFLIQTTISTRSILISFSELFIGNFYDRRVAQVEFVETQPAFWVLKKVSDNFYEKCEEGGQVETDDALNRGESETLYNVTVIENQESVCYVCNEKQPNGVSENCLHGGFCYDCGLEFLKKKLPCSFCRVQLTSIFKVSQEKEEKVRILKKISLNNRIRL